MANPIFLTCPFFRGKINAYVSGEGGLHIIGVSNPAYPYAISSLGSAGGRDLEVIDDTAFVSGPDRVFAADVSNVYAPAHVFPIILTGTNCSNGINVANDLIYIANGDSGLTVVDPYHGAPYVVSSFPLGVGPINCMSQDLVLVDDTIVFIGGEPTNSAKVLNVADPYAVDSIAKCGIPGQRSLGMDYENNYLYVARYEDGLFMNNVANRAWPLEVGNFRESEDEPLDIEVQGATGYLLFQDTIVIVDLSDPSDITQIGWAEVGMNYSLEVAGNVMLVGNTVGVTAYDISNPAAPVYLDICETNYQYVHSMEVRSHYAYITMWRYGYGIIDISDPSNLVMVGSYVNSDYWPELYDFGNTGWVFVDGYAIIPFYSPESLDNGLLVLDISDPTNPQPLKECVLPGQVVCVDAIGSLLYFAHDHSDSVFVWNISDPLNPIQVASWRPAGFQYFWANVITHTGGYLLVEDYYSGTLLVVDPSGWSESCSTGEVARFKNHRIATDIATAGNHVYVTSYGGLVALTLGLDFVCGDVNDDGGFGIDIADLVYLVDYMFTGGPPPPDMVAANIDGVPGITISDLVYLVDFMFNSGPPPIC